MKLTGCISGGENSKAPIAAFEEHKRFQRLIICDTFSVVMPVFVALQSCMFWIRDLLVLKGFRYTSAVSCTLQRMASQFTGNDKANLLSTALEADSGDNIAITSTSDAVALGLTAKTPSFLAKTSQASLHPVV